MNFFRWILDIIFPVNCVLCGRDGALCCSRCLGKIRAEPKVSYVNGFSVLSFVEFKDVKELVHAFKYQYMRGLAGCLASFMSCEEEYDLVIPVPLHKRRVLERGYSQNLLLAREVFGADDVRDDILQRVKYTKSQTTLSREERAINMSGVFEVSAVSRERRDGAGSAVKGKRVVLVDDVVTTGATLCECAKALLDAGALSVFGVVLARD